MECKKVFESKDGVSITVAAAIEALKQLPQDAIIIRDDEGLKFRTTTIFIAPATEWEVRNGLGIKSGDILVQFI